MPTPDFTIVTARERMDMIVEGQFRKVMEVHFRTKHGATGSVRIPVEEFDPNKAREIVAAKAKELDSLFG